MPGQSYPQWSSPTLTPSEPISRPLTPIASTKRLLKRAYIHLSPSSSAKSSPLSSPPSSPLSSVASIQRTPTPSPQKLRKSPSKRLSYIPTSRAEVSRMVSFMKDDQPVQFGRRVEERVHLGVREYAYDGERYGMLYGLLSGSFDARQGQSGGNGVDKNARARDNRRSMRDDQRGDGRSGNYTINSENLLYSRNVEQSTPRSMRDWSRTPDSMVTGENSEESSSFVSSKVGRSADGKLVFTSPGKHGVPLHVIDETASEEAIVVDEDERDDGKRVEYRDKGKGRAMDEETSVYDYFVDGRSQQMVDFV